MTSNSRPSLRYHLPVALVAAALSSACSSLSSPAPSGPHPGLAVFNQAINQPVRPDTIVREGDKVSYLAATSPEAPVLARFEIACNGTSASMFYRTDRGMMPFSHSPTSTRLPRLQFEQLQQSDQLKSVCEQRPVPDWRVLDTAEGKDWLLIDLRSVRVEDGVLKAWTGKHYYRQQLNGANRELISQERERLAISCDEQTLKVASHFTLDVASRVLNGWVRPEDDFKPVKEATPDHQRLYEAICKGGEALSALPSFEPRTSRPILITSPRVSPQVIADIETLGLQAPRLNLKKVNYRYDAALFNGARFDGRAKTDLISVDEASGQVLVQPTENITDPQVRLTFRGLFELARTSIDRKTGKEVELSTVTAVRFTGNWQDLPPNSEVAYTLTRTQNTLEGPRSQGSTVTCKIGEEGPASRYNAGLQGTAKPINCIKMKTRKMEWSERFIFLNDYGVFLHTFENSVLGRWAWYIESVE